MNKEPKDLQQKIISQWAAFSGTEAYRDFIQSMSETMQMIQDNVDNMTESRPSGVLGKMTIEPISMERAQLLNQRKVGIRYATEYIKLRVESE